MYIEEFKNLLSIIQKNNIERDEYVDKLNALDNSVCSSVFDNFYTNSILFENEMLMEAMFGKVLYEDVCWFLFECKDRNDSNKIWMNNVCYTINNVDDFVEYVRQNHKFPI